MKLHFSYSGRDPVASLTMSSGIPSQGKNGSKETTLLTLQIKAGILLKPKGKVPANTSKSWGMNPGEVKQPLLTSDTCWCRGSFSHRSLIMYRFQTLKNIYVKQFLVWSVSQPLHLWFIGVKCSRRCSGLKAGQILPYTMYLTSGPHSMELWLLPHSLKRPDYKLGRMYGSAQLALQPWKMDGVRTGSFD